MQRIPSKQQNGDFCEELLSENDFEAVLATQKGEKIITNAHRVL